MERRINGCAIYISNRNFRNLYKMESAWQLYSYITVEHFLTSLYDEEMKFSFATFQGGHRPLKLIAFGKSKKKRTLLYFLVKFSLTSPSLLLKFPIIFNQELLFQLKWRRLRKLVPSYNINFSSICLIFYHNEILSRYCFTRSLYLFASCFIFFTPKNIWFWNKCLILNLSPFISDPIHYMDRQLVE